MQIPEWMLSEGALELIRRELSAIDYDKHDTPAEIREEIAAARAEVDGVIDTRGPIDSSAIAEAVLAVAESPGMVLFDLARDIDEWGETADLAGFIEAVRQVALALAPGGDGTSRHDVVGALLIGLATDIDEIALDGEPEDIFEAFVSRLHPKTRGHLLLQIIGGSDGKLTAAEKAEWLAYAEVLGPDWTQALYHRAVFATKVA